MASLLVSDSLWAKEVHVIQLPDAVSILTDQGTVPLRSSGKAAWAYRDVEVTLKKSGNSLAVRVTSPTLSLKEVQLSWIFAAPKEVKVLGDAWERTYADVSFQRLNAARKMPWYCVEHSAEGTVCFGVKTGCNTFCYWRAAQNKLELNLDTRNGGNGVLLGKRTLHAADVVTTRNRDNENVFATVSRFCRQMCERPLKVKQPVYGINDWYFAYGKNSAELILGHTALLAPLAANTANRPFSVIDDGWSEGTDYRQPNRKFPDMPGLVSRIQGLGMRAGLWTRPLLARPGTRSNRFVEKHGEVLDPTIDENLHDIQELFRLYRQWGFELIKHDYTTFELFGKYGMDMGETLTFPGWHFNDRSKTNAEIILNMYKAMRAAAEGSYLMGCNTVSHLSAGLFEIYRIGDDTSGKEWDRTKRMGVNTLGFRLVQHRSFYEADGDCVGLTAQVPWEKNKQWMQLLAQSGTPLFISAEAAAVGEEQKKFIKQCFDEAARPLPAAEPLDWLDNIYPAQWRLNDRVVTFNWD